MVRAGINGLQVSFPTMVEFLIFLGCEGVNFPLQTIGFMGSEELLQKFCLHISPIPNSSRPQRVEPDFSLGLQSKREELQSHHINIRDVLFKGIAYFLELPDV